MKFATKLTFILLAGILLIATVTSYFSFRYTAGLLNSQIKNKLQAHAYHIMDEVDRVLYERLSDVKVFAHDSVVSSRMSTREQLTERLIEFRDTAKYYVSLSFLDSNKIIKADTLGFNVGIEDPELKSREIEDARKGFTMDVINSSLLGFPILRFAHPVRDSEGVVFGILVSRMPIGRLHNLVKNEIDINEGFNVELINKDGLLLYSDHERGGVLKKKAGDWQLIEKSIAGRDSGVFAGYNPELQEREIFAFYRQRGYFDYKSNGWIAVVHISEKKAFEEADKIGYRLLLIFLVLACLLMPVAIIFSKSVSGPIIKLKKAAEEVSRGKLDTKISVNSKDEIGSLAGSFNKMVENLNKSKVELLDEKAFSDDIIASIQDTLIVVNLSGFIKRTNGATLELLGYGEKELIGLHIKEIFAKDERTAIFWEGKIYEQILENIVVRDYEMSYLSKNKVEIPAVFTASLICQTICPVHDRPIEECEQFKVRGKHCEKITGIIIVGRDMRQTRMLIADLEAANLKLRALSDTLEHKVNERTKDLAQSREAALNIMEDLELSRQELERINQKLRVLDQLKSDFISTVSHELRTPLTVVREAVSQILDGILGPTTDQQRDFLNICLQDLDRLKRIIDNLLDISRIETGKVQLKREMVDIVQLASGINTFFSSKIEDKGLVSKLIVSAEKIEIYVDKDKIIQVFTNLIGNAIKFTDRGYIEIAVNDRESFIECYVLDTGKGISKDDLPKVFDKFQQFGRAAGPGEKGTGLGLSIAKGIVVLHGGKIWVESRLGEGSKFIFVLPRLNQVSI